MKPETVSEAVEMLLDVIRAEVAGADPPDDGDATALDHLSSVASSLNEIADSLEVVKQFCQFAMGPPNMAPSLQFRTTS